MLGHHHIDQAAYLSALQYFIQVSRTVKDRGRASMATKNNEFMQAVRFLPPFALQMYRKHLPRAQVLDG
jgi:hypothetical protein